MCVRVCVYTTYITHIKSYHGDNKLHIYFKENLGKI